MAQDGLISVFIADDHQFIIAGVKMSLEATGGFTVAGHTEDPHKVVDEYDRHRPDVVLLDMSFRGHGRKGLDVLADLLKFDPGARVVVLSQHDQEFIVKEAYRLGAKSYVLKNEGALEALVPAIEAAAKGVIHVTPAVSGKIAEWELHGTSLAKLFTPDQLAYFKLFARNKKTEEVAQIIGVSLRTATSMKREIKSILNVETDPEIIEAAIRAGLIESPLDL